MGELEIFRSPYYLSTKNYRELLPPPCITTMKKQDRHPLLGSWTLKSLCVQDTSLICRNAEPSLKNRDGTLTLDYTDRGQLTMVKKRHSELRQTCLIHFLPPSP